jgi:formiminotetrahydrofolate cyclodeaminase
MLSLVEKAESLLKTLTLSSEEDAAAFTSLMQAMRLPKDNEEQQAARSQAIIQATLEAARVPLKVASLAVDVMKLNLDAARLGNLNAISDAASGFSMARAALNAAGLNVRINLNSLDDPTPGQPLLEELVRYERNARDMLFGLRRTLAERSDMTLPD